MDNKIKLLVIGLGVLAAISLLIAFQLNITNNGIRVRKEAIERELAQVSKDNEKLAKDLSAALAKNKTFTTTLEETEAKGKGLQEEIARLREKLDLISSERDGLIDKMQTLVGDKAKIQEELDKERAKSKEKKEEGGVPSAGAPTSVQEAYWADVLRQKANAELELENVKTQLKEITYRADELLREKNAIEMELKSITALKEDFQRRSSYNEKLANTLSEDLVREKTDKEAVLSQLDKLRDDTRQMSVRIKDLENTKATLYKKIDNLEQERSALGKKLGETESIVSERVDQIVKMKNDLQNFQTKEMPAVVAGSRTVELSPIVVHGKQDVKAALTGRVLSVNKQNEFVIIDLGASSEIKVNDRLNVYRDNKFIANIEVIMIRKDISAADLIEIATGEEVKVGDIVRLAR